MPPSLRIEALANGEANRLVAWLRSRAFITGPAEVAHRGRQGIGNPVNLLPAAPPHVPDPEFSSAGSERKAKGIAESVAHNALGVGICIGGEGIIGEARSCERIHPDEGTI